MTGTFRWHSCSTNDFPLKRHKVSKACEACRGKKMRCDGNNPCERCESNKIACKYNDKPSRSRSIPHVKKTIQLSSSNSSLTLSPPPPPLAPAAPASSSSEAIASSTPSSPTPPPLSPNKKRVKKSEKMLPISCLNKMTLINELYETLRLQQSPKTSRYGTSHPPLLLDFFNITSQPQSIWTHFIELLTKISDQVPTGDTIYFIQNVPEQESNELVKEAFRIFIAHNWLYGAFLDTSILCFLSTNISIFSNMQQQSNLQTKGLPFHPSSLPFYSIIIYCILAITFQSAHQALPTINKNISHCLYFYSHWFYRDAHKLFLSLCFPSLPADPTLPKENRTHMILLVQASVLLCHFQATAISEEQAFLTLKIGIGLVEQASLTTLIDDEQECLIALLKSLDAWYVWLSFYLIKPYSTLEFDIHITTCEFNSMTKEQRWALDLTDNYTFFLKNLLKKRTSTQPLINFNTIKDSLKSIVISNEEEEEELIPNHTIQVYHDILTIQFYTSQLENYELILEKGTIDITTVNEILHVLISSCQSILTRVNKLICTKYNQLSRYIPLSFIYAVSFVSDILLKNKELITTHKEFDILHSSLLKTLKTYAPYFEAFQILYSKFSSTPKKLDTSSKAISPSPTSLSTSSSTTTSTTNPLQPSLTTISEVMIGSETQFLSSFQNNSNHQDLLIVTAADAQQQHMSMNLPMTGAISSRADIDREQLEKLSHNKSQHHYPTQQQQQQHQQYQQHQQHQQQQQQQQQQQFQQQQQQHHQIQQQYLFEKQFQLQQQQSDSTYYLQKSMKRNENMYQQQSMNEQPQYYINPKRPYQQMYTTLGYPMPPQQSTLKRQRSNPTYDYSKSQPASVVMETPTHHERSKSVATEYIDLETNNDAFIYSMIMYNNTATSTPTAEEIFDGNSRHFFPTTNQQQQQEMTNNLTKLPLPQPSKPTSMISKTSWTASGPTQPQTSSKIFFDSEVQTLHYQASSFPTTMSGLTVIPEVEDGLCLGQRASTVSDSSNSSEPILTTTHNVVVEQEAVVAAAVANWAHPASSLVYKRQYNDSIASTSSSLDENDRFHHQQQQPGTSHWINQEKVGDEEFWGE